MLAVALPHCRALPSAGEDASMPITTGGNYQTLVNNVFYFTQRVVDKLWQGMFNKESKLVVEFIVQLISQVRGTEWTRSWVCFRCCKRKWQFIPHLQQT